MSTPPSSAEIVKQARLLRGLTQGDFGAEIGRNQGVISKYEAGRVKPPGDVIIHCMNILGRVPATSGALPPELERVNQAVAQLRSALDGLMAAVFAARDTNAPHPPHSRAAAPGRT